MNKFKEKIKREFKYLSTETNFFYSRVYTVLIAVFVYVIWLTNTSPYGILALGILIGVLMCICRDLTPIVPPIFLFVQMIRKTEEAFDGFYMYLYIATLAVILVGAIIHIIKYRPFHNYGHLKGFTVATIFLGLAISLGGLDYSFNRYWLYQLVCIGYGIFIILFAIFCIKTLGRDSNRRLTQTVTWAIFMSVCIAMLQIITLIIQSDDPIGMIASKYELEAGYANANYLGNIIARGIPIFVYFSTREKRGNYWWLLGAYACGLFIVITSCRSALLFGGLMGVVSLIYFGKNKNPNKKAWISVIIFLIGITMVLAGIFYSKFTRVFAQLSGVGLDDNGRFELWTLGLQRFAKHWIFGNGFDFDIGNFVSSYRVTNSWTPFWYHNTVIQVLTCLGTVGFVALAFWIFRQYQAFAAIKDHPLIKSVFFVLILIQAISLLDVHFFTPQEMLQMIIITMVAIKSLPKDKYDAGVYTIINKVKEKKIKKKNELTKDESNIDDTTQQIIDSNQTKTQIKSILDKNEEDK